MAAKRTRSKSTSKAEGKDRRVRNEDPDIAVKDYPEIRPHLSRRELEVALAMGEGMTCPEASGALGVSVVRGPSSRQDRPPSESPTVPLV